MQSLINTTITKQLRPRKKLPIIHRSLHSLPDRYAKIIGIYGRDRALHRGNLLHAHLITTGLYKSTQIATKLIQFYTECRKISDAYKVFDEMPKGNIRGWIMLIGAFSRCGYYKESLNIFTDMQKHRLKPNRFVIPSILKACGYLVAQESGEILHCVVLKCLFHSDVFIVTALIDMYSKCGDLEKSKRVFDEITGKKDLVALNALVSGYVQSGLANEGLRLVEEMRVFGVEPNLITFNTLISGFSRMGDDETVSKLLGNMQDHGFEPDVVSWTSVISGLVQNFKTVEAFSTLKKILNSGLYPNSATLSSILPLCSAMAFNMGEEVHGYAIVTGLEDDLYLRSALVDMYSKSGYILSAKSIFNKIREKNTVTYNSMIFAYANHGYYEKAIELFNHMEIKPDHLTFTAVLTACSHGALIDLGQELFRLMQEKYHISPRLEHYACMTDILGRAGKVVEAYDMIKGMAMEPDFFVWGALLSACRSYGNVEIGEVAAKYLSELEPESAGNNLLLSDLYANSGNWENVVRLKKMVKRKKLRKIPGCSWIETS